MFDNGRAFYHAALTEDQLIGGVLPYDARVFDNGEAGSLALVGDFSWLDFDSLRAFAPTVGEILAQTRHPAWFAPAAQRQFLLRVQALERAALGGSRRRQAPWRTLRREIASLKRANDRIFV